MVPLEPITALIGLALGAWTKIQQQRNETMQIAISRDKMEIDDRQYAREQSKSNPGIQWTKRCLALALVGTWCALHLGVSVPELLGLTSQVTIGYTEIIPKFLFFGEKEAFRWVTTAGSTITPAFSHAVMLILGYYFGSGGTRKS